MSAHTPGPWNGFEAWSSSSGTSYTIRARGSTIAEVIPQEAAHANARLIAQAPEMVWLLLDMLKSDGRCRIDNWHGQIERILGVAGVVP